MNLINVNEALFKLICTDYSTKDANILIDVLNNNQYVVDFEYIDILYSKYLVLFNYDDQINLISKIHKEGKLDISIIHLYDISCFGEFKEIGELMKKLLLHCSEVEFIRIMHYINCSLVKSHLIKDIMEHILLNDFQTAEFIVELQNIFIVLLNQSDNENIKNITQEIFLKYYNNLTMYICTDKIRNIIDRTELISRFHFENDNDLLILINHLDAKVYSDFLTDKRNVKILNEFIISKSYNNMSLIKSLRDLFNRIILPKESQSIILILELFSDHFLNCNLLQFKDHSNILMFQFICTILMLNTDLHNPNIHKKMSLSNFIKNWYNNIDRKKQIHVDILRLIYHEIKNSKFEIRNS